MHDNKNLRKACVVKNDEFYTFLEDIEEEVAHNKNHFKNQIVYCNCDDYRISNFFKYFHDNFHQLCLKKLISTCYKEGQCDLFMDNVPQPSFEGDLIGRGIYAEYDGKRLSTRILNGNGDFSSKECIAILKNADIIITNPPFSVFRKYIHQLIIYKKKFLIVGSLNAIPYKDIFLQLMEKKIWLGINKLMKFYTDDDKIAQVACFWYTNFTKERKNKYITLTKYYNENDYPKYDNYDAINVDKLKDIPMEYAGEMGVPFTIMHRYNPEQFEIIGLDNHLTEKSLGKVENFILYEKELYKRIVIKNRILGTYTTMMDCFKEILLWV